MGYLDTQFNHATRALLSLSVILLAGFVLTRVTKRFNLPNVTGYILAGILIGPHMLGLVGQSMVAGMGFVSDIALAFIAFGVGRFFTKEAFDDTGAGIIVITVMESVVAGILVCVSVHVLFDMSWSFCLLLGAIATATAPASTMLTINQYHARGTFVNTLLQVVAFDDAVCLIVFSLAAALVKCEADGGISAGELLLPIFYNLLSLLLGLVCALVLSKLVTPTRSEDNRLILTTALLLGLSGACAAVDVSPLLCCMVFGASYVNISHDKALFHQLERFTPPIYALFFVVSGMNLDLSTFSTLGLVGCVYFALRIVGKYFGAYLGCAMAKTAPQVKQNLGLALLPQAGVAIGLAFLGQRILPAESGNMLLTIILSSSVLYELTGPACAKFALVRAGAIKVEQVSGKCTQIHCFHSKQDKHATRVS